jgi:hypothetical protein
MTDFVYRKSHISKLETRKSAMAANEGGTVHPQPSGEKACFHMDACER